MRKSLKTIVRANRAHLGVPAALIGTLAATLVATPAEAAPMPSEREPRPHWRGVPAAPPATTHVVAPGESVWSIATSHGLRPADVLSWNGLDWSSVIRPGQVLKLSAPATSAPAPAPAPAPAAPTMVSHTVVAGDTLSGIARRHGIALRALFDANGLGWSSVIYPGQTLNVPGVVPAAAVTPVAAPAPAPAPVPAQATHTVVRGDTLSAIAKKYGVSLAAVFAANGLGAGSIIYPGQAIAVPGVAAPAAAPAPAASVQGLDAEQIQNARLIIQIGRELGVSDRGIAIALATAMVESWIRNLDWGDRDSLGLYQQRPSTGWGSPAEIRDASRSIRVFYGGPSDPNGNRTRGLLDIRGWEGMGFSQAAQAVQRSAFPDRYGAWEAAAYQWIAALG